MKIIIIDKARGKGGHQARIHGSQPLMQSFAKTEVEALRQLAEKIIERNSKDGKTGDSIYRMLHEPTN